MFLWRYYSFAIVGTSRYLLWQKRSISTAQGWFLLCGGIMLAPPAAAPAPAPPATKQFGILPAPSSSVAPNDASNGSRASSSLLTSWSIGSPNANRGGDPPSLGRTSCFPVPIGSLPAVCTFRIPPRQLPQATHFLHPPRPDPKGFDDPPFAMGGSPYQAGGGTPLSMGGAFLLLGGLMGGLIFTVGFSATCLLALRLTTDVCSTSMAVFLQRYLLLSTVRALHTHLMGGLPMRLHLWCLRSLL